MVISQKISEKIMGYRGSKSDFISKSVKEQRVDGSWRKRNSLSFKVYSNGFRKKLSSQNPFLANIFKGFSINFVRNVSTLPVRQLKLHPYFVTGFSDGESYFSIGISKSSKMKTG
jgi:hypothetical protein